MLGDRRDHFESLKDVWEMFRIIVDERKKREADPSSACCASGRRGEEAGRRRRLHARAAGRHAAVLRADDRVGRADAQAADAGARAHGQGGRQDREDVRMIAGCPARQRHGFGPVWRGIRCRSTRTSGSASR